MLVFFDYEVFCKNWLVVFIEPLAKKETVIVDDPEKLRQFYESHKDDIYIGYNCRNYDQWIYKAILAGFDPYEMNEHIITKNKKEL